MIKGNLILNLKKFGLSENEAKAYTGLVFLKEASAREIHAFTKVPRAKVYEVLENLVEKRYATILHGTPAHYRATDPEDLMQMLREDYEKTADEISKSFEEMETDPEEEGPTQLISIQYLRSEWTVRKKMNEILEETHKNLIIFARSPPIMKEIEGDLISANKRLNILILVNDAKGYERYPIPVTVYHENVRVLLQGLEESHIENQSCTIVSDAGKALAIRLDETKMEAHYTSQSMVDYLYKTVYYFVTNADSIHLPDHFDVFERKQMYEKINQKDEETDPEEIKKCKRNDLKNQIKTNIKGKFKK